MPISAKDHLDRYYTPYDVALRVASSFPSRQSSQPLVVADGACGRGILLQAAEDCLGGVACVGVDIDKGAIRHLRRRCPHWDLSVGDMLSKAARLGQECDYVILNPPFSLKARDGTKSLSPDAPVRCSVAMAHVLANIRYFSPAVGGSMIVPESMMFSDTDAEGRSLLYKKFKLTIVADLVNTTFAGAKATALIVRLERGASVRRNLPPVDQWSADAEVEIIRGGVPVHEACFSRRGIPFVHTTNLERLAIGGVAQSRLVMPIERGVVFGSVILIPRVGRFPLERVAVHQLGGPVQLSDCVIALKFGSRKAARSFHQKLTAKPDRLLSLYHGTGAKYLTVARLQSAIESSGGIVHVTR